MFSACSDHIHHPSCPILTQLDERMQFYNKITLVMVQFSVRHPASESGCPPFKLTASAVLNFQSRCALQRSAAALLRSGLNNAHAASSLETLNGFMTKVFLDTHLCRITVAQGGEKDLPRLPHYNLPDRLSARRLPMHPRQMIDSVSRQGNRATVLLDLHGTKTL